MDTAEIISQAVIYIADNLTIKLEQPGPHSIKAKLLLRGHVISEDTINYEPRETKFC